MHNAANAAAIGERARAGARCEVEGRRTRSHVLGTTAVSLHRGVASLHYALHSLWESNSCHSLWVRSIDVNATRVALTSYVRMSSRQILRTYPHELRRVFLTTHDGGRPEETGDATGAVAGVTLPLHSPSRQTRV